MTATIKIQGRLTADDEDAALYIIDRENTRREALNAAAAAEDPPGAVLDLLPVTTPAEIKDSYEAVWDRIIETSHADYIRQAAEAGFSAKSLAKLTRDQRQRIKAIKNETN